MSDHADETNTSPPPTDEAAEWVRCFTLQSLVTPSCRGTHGRGARRRGTAREGWDPGPCGDLRDCYCGGRPGRPPHCDDGLFVAVGPVATAPRCHLSAAGLATAEAERDRLLSFLGCPGTRRAEARTPWEAP